MVGDGVGRHHQVDLTALDQRLALGGWRLDPGDLVGGGAELAGDVGGDVHVKAGVLVAVLEAEAGLVELDADLEGLQVGAATAGAG